MLQTGITLQSININNKCKAQRVREVIYKNKITPRQIIEEETKKLSEKPLHGPQS